MNFIQRWATLCYVTSILFVACFFLLFTLHGLNLSDVVSAFGLIYQDQHARLIVGIWAGLLLLKNFIYYQFFFVDIYSRKMIIFDNPSGRVSVTLAAMEDLIKRTIARSTEVKVTQTMVIPSKKGMRIKIKLILNSEMNIPEVTARVQVLVQNKIQDMIGISDPVRVSIDIVKILPEGSLDKKFKDSSTQSKDDDNELNIPFQGYRA